MIDFARLNDELLLRVHDLLPEWIPGGKFAGKEYVGTNPTRDDRHAGSFSVNANNGKWADFATNDKGGDLSSLYAHLRKLSQAAAATELINTLGLTYCANGTASNGAGRESRIRSGRFAIAKTTRKRAISALTRAATKRSVSGGKVRTAKANSA